MKRGFTLIEISIVLVIVALLVAGIVVGKEMIATATARAQISEWDKWRANIGAFQNKYNCLPGDCSTATKFFSSVTNGDGNKLLQSGPLVYFWGSEPIYLFQHMNRAGLTQLTGTTGGWSANTQADVGRGIPSLQINKTATWFIAANAASNCATTYPAGAPYIQSGMNYFFTGIWESTQNETRPNNFYTSEQTLGTVPAFYIDSKMDDGVPTSGSVLAIRTYDHPCYFQQIDRASSNICVATSGQYKLSDGTPTLCSIAVKAGF